MFPFVAYCNDSLANHDSLVVNLLHDLRLAESHHIQSLLEAGSEGTPSDVVPGEGERLATPSESHPSDTAPYTTASHAGSQGVNTLASTDAAQSYSDGSFTDNADAIQSEETSPDLEPTADSPLESPSSLDPHTIPLPQSDDPELNVEDDVINNDQALSDEEAVGSDLESDGLTTHGHTSDDESHAGSTVDSDEVGEVHVSDETENQDSMPQAEGESSSPAHDFHIENTSATHEEPSSSTIVGLSLTQGSHVDVESTPVDQTISAQVDFDSSDTSNSHPAPFLETPRSTENVGHLAQSFGDVLPTTLTPSNPQRSGDIQDVKESNLTSTSESCPDVIPDPAHLSTPDHQSSEPASEKQNASSLIDDLPPAGLFNIPEENTPEVAHPSDAIPDNPSSEAVNNSQNLQTNEESVSSEQPVIEALNIIEETNAETIRLSESGQSRSESEVTADNSATGGHSIGEELDPLTFEDSANHTVTVPESDIPVAYTGRSAIVVPVGLSLDISASVSPASSSRSIFTDSPFTTRMYEFQLVTPVSPGLCLGKGDALHFCEGKLLAGSCICRN